MQLSGWRANVDMQYVVSRRRVINYVAKYATKSEPRSKSLKTVYRTIMKNLKDDDKSLKVVQKILINSIGERDYSAQETCHLLLQLPMYLASRDFVILSLDGSREVDNKLDEGKVVTIDSYLDHYSARPATTEFQDLTICSLWNGTGFQRELVMTWSTGRRRWLSLSVHTAPLIQKVQSMSNTAGRSS